MKTTFKLCIAILLGMAFFIPKKADAAGVTVITHGLKGNTDGWVSSMADQITKHPSHIGSNHTVYELYFSKVGSMYVINWRRASGTLPSSTDSGEIVIKLDWRELADASLLLGNTAWDTTQVAPPIVHALTSSDFIPELGGHALCEFPLHLTGHSRGGSLMCEVSRLLGRQGIWVDQMTTLDPHPLNDAEFPEDVLLYPQVWDAPALCYENVLFHDNYFQKIGVATGKSVFGAYNRQLTYLTGGYEAVFIDTSESHGDVHLWYHATIDLALNVSDSEASIGFLERQNWYSSYEQQGARAGFHYSLIGRGDRFSTAQPVGSGVSAPQIRDGFNQLWNFGAGHVGNRTRLSTNSGNWPNVMKLNVTSTNVVSHGQDITAKIYLQWARTPGSTGSIEFHCDDDLNPLNGNSRLIKEFTFQSNGPDNIGIYPVDLPINPTNSPAGHRAVFAKIQAEGKTRYLYAPEILTVLAAPVIDLARSGQQWTIGVDGEAGQRIIIETSTNLPIWSPVATNQLATNRWVYTPAQQAPESFRFYRARTAP